jgi:hypothetical protein
MFKMIASSIAVAAFDSGQGRAQNRNSLRSWCFLAFRKEQLPYGIYRAYDTYALAVGAGRTRASLLGETRSAGSGEFVPARPIVSN